ncbi:hypothetical protein AcV5_008070 [Taiwanofungus camphoratus]|nr:hypothetical protein AcV5_008070 [Antrodia cinnamomea]
MSLSTVDLNSLIATRYMAAVAVTCSLWNHLINVDREIEFVWRPPWSFLQLLVMFNLYGGQASLIFIVYVLGDLRPPLHLSMCKAYVLFVCVYGTLSTGSTQFALLLRVYALWDNRKEIKYALITGFIICYSLSVGFAVATMQKFFNKLQYSMSLDSCFLPEKADYLIGVWGGMTLYDVYILMFVVVNVLNKPRRRDSEIVTNLIRDGALTFMGFFG